MNIKRVFIIFIYAFSCGCVLFSQSKPDALVLYKQGLYTQAVDVCEQELVLNPNNIDSYVVMTWALLADKQYEKTYDKAVLGRRIAQTEPRLIAAQGEACYHLGKNAEALKLFQDYISYAPNGVKLSNLYYFMGEIYLRMAKYRHADISFSVAVSLDSYNSYWWVRLGYAREGAREYRYALEAYTEALRLNKNLIDAQKGLERVLKQF